MRSSTFINSVLAVVLILVSGSGPALARDGERGHQSRAGYDRPYVRSPNRQRDAGHVRGDHERHGNRGHRYSGHRASRYSYLEERDSYRHRPWRHPGHHRGHHRGHYRGHHSGYHRDHYIYAPRWRSPYIDDGRWLFGLFYLD